MAEQQVLGMARPAAYWARRAAFHHRRGNRRQAEVLYQHALDLTPDDISLQLSYARVLQETQRHEASNRQAFAALSQDADNPVLIGMIGMNLMAMGYLEEAADAFAHVLDTAPDSMADVYADQLDRLDMLLYPAREPCARYRVLTQRAAECMAEGAWEQAKPLLTRACAIYHRDERCHALMALYYRETGDREQAIAQAAAACAMAPHNPRTHSTLAELYAENHQHGRALQALLRAAACVLSAEDEHLLCQSAIRLGFPTAVLPALTRLGGSVHTLYNQSVLWLLAGKPQRALPLLDRCRMLDPDDVPTRFLRRSVQALAELPAGEAASVKGQRLYPALSDADSEACFRTFIEALESGVEPFAKRLETDTALYRLLLYQAGNPYTDITGLLKQVFGYLKENVTHKLLRDILTQPMGGSAEKQLAIDLLLERYPQPFVLWHDGRLSFIKPHTGSETADTLRLKDALLRFKGTANGPALAAHALALIRRMPPRMRRAVAAAQPSAFCSAVRIHYAQCRPAAGQPQAIPRLHHVLRIYHMLSRIAPAPGVAARPPKLWLSGGREEN
ncbi:MAG TPA: hypothetical protein PK537_00080 [Candidatus Limiplasma sp.]|nr:hypothetical protein [Candidatus Limiplasma sp.]